MMNIKVNQSYVKNILFHLLSSQHPVEIIMLWNEKKRECMGDNPFFLPWKMLVGSKSLFNGFICRKNGSERTAVLKCCLSLLSNKA